MLDINVNLNGKTILVTGAAGFIGSNLCKQLMKNYENINLVGLDSITDYYDVNIKYERLKELDALASETKQKWTFVKEDLANSAAIAKLFEKYHFVVLKNGLIE